MCDDNGKSFIATLYNVLLAPNLCDRLFSIITLMNSGHACLFHKGFCTVYFGSQKQNAVTLPHSAQRKNTFLGKIKDMSKKNQLTARKKIFIITTSEIRTQIHQIIVSWVYCKCLVRCRDTNRSIPFLHIVPNLFIEKKARSKISLKPKAPFKWFFMDTIPSTAPKILTSDTTFSNYLLIVDAYSKIQKIYGMEKITTEEVMEKLDMFLSSFGI